MPRPEAKQKTEEWLARMANRVPKKDHIEERSFDERKGVRSNCHGRLRNTKTGKLHHGPVWKRNP